jgi:sugar lactone lactonase YvrE
MMMGAAGAAGGANPNAWDVSKAYYDVGPDAWDISKAFYSGVNKSVSAQETSPTGLFFKPDGTKMYVLGAIGDDVNEYDLSIPWLVSSASYVQNFSVASQDTAPNDLFFKSDGTKMYIVGNTGDDINEYDLSTPWDISTTSFVRNFSVASQETEPRGLFFKPDGTKMYICGTVGENVNEYDLSTPWNISTASYVQNFSVATQETAPQSLSFKPDGTKMYVLGDSGDDINEYDLVTPWDISTASYVQNFSVASQETEAYGLFFKPDGSAFYVSGLAGDTVYQYTIGGFSVLAQETAATGLFFKPDGAKVYIIGVTGDDVNEYDLSTPWDITTASYVQNFSVATQETNPTGLFFKPDGTKMYAVGTNSNNVNEYDLSTPWDISTASYVQNFAVTGNAQDVFFKPDGTTMYVVANVADRVQEYSLSSAWDVSTASSVRNFSVVSQENSPLGLFFKSDGAKMYVCGAQKDNVNEYDLSTPWNISTASFVQGTSFLVTDPGGLFWKDDGEQFWLISANADKILSYKISET